MTEAPAGTPPAPLLSSRPALHSPPARAFLRRAVRECAPRSWGIATGTVPVRGVTAMKTRALGSQGLEVSAEGLGCMGMSEFYGATDEAEAIATIHDALDLGVTLLDTSDIYGPFTNE